MVEMEGGNRGLKTGQRRRLMPRLMDILIDGMGFVQKSDGDLEIKDIIINVVFDNGEEFVCTHGGVELQKELDRGKMHPPPNEETKNGIDGMENVVGDPLYNSRKNEALDLKDKIQKLFDSTPAEFRIYPDFKDWFDNLTLKTFNKKYDMDELSIDQLREFWQAIESE